MIRDMTKPLPSLDHLLACPECDLLMKCPVVTHGLKVSCACCGYTLINSKPKMVTRSLALVLSALLLYIPANFLPIMKLNLLGRVTEETVWSGVSELYKSGMPEVAIVVFMCAMAIPLLKLLCQLWVLLSIRFDMAKGLGLLAYRIYHHLREWGMLEVYLISTLVALVKLVDMADLTLDIGMACFIGLLVVQILLEVVMTPHEVWRALESRHYDARY